MKMWKKSIAVGVLSVMVTLPVGAESLKTVGGTMELPKGVSAYTLSESNYFETVATMVTGVTSTPATIYTSNGNKAVAVGIIGGTPATSTTSKAGVDKTAEGAHTPNAVHTSNGTPPHNQSKVPATASSMKEELQQYGDFYELKGQDKTGYKTAQVIAISGKEFLKDPNLLGKKDAVKKAAMISMLKKGGPLDPALEKALLEKFNTEFIAIDAKINTALNKQQPNKPLSPVVATVTLEDKEMLAPMSKTKYSTYTTGSRVLVDVNGFQLPYYVKAAVVLKPEEPVAYVFITSDVERNYFKPVINKMLGSLK